MKSGDKVEILKGKYKGLVGTLSKIYYGKQYYVVNIDGNKDQYSSYSKTSIKVVDQKIKLSEQEQKSPSLNQLIIDKFKDEPIWEIYEDGVLYEDGLTLNEAIGQVNNNFDEDTKGHIHCNVPIIEFVIPPLKAILKHMG